MSFDRPAYMKNYREENKEELRLKEAIKYQNNRENKLQYEKDKYAANPEAKNQYDKEYNKTDAGKIRRRKASWKSRGLIFETKEEFEEIYERYINTWFCDLCNCPLHEGNTGSGKRVMDHDHVTGKFRNILCNHCNIKQR